MSSKNNAANLPNQINRPNEEILRTFLAHEGISPAATIIRLAWDCGLRRVEIPLVRWTQLDLEKRELSLPDRIIPVPEETASYLGALAEEGNNSEYVLVSRRGISPLSEESVSMITRRAMNSIGLTEVKLSDLRSDYILRQLEENEWELVSYIAGVDQHSLREGYLPYINKKDLRYKREAERSAELMKQLHHYMDEKGRETSGLALRLICELGIAPSSLPELCWDMVDWANSQILFDEKSFSMSRKTYLLLEEYKTKAPPEEPNIFLTETTQKPMDYPYLQRIISKGLVRNGLLDIQLQKLHHWFWLEKHEEGQVCETKAPKWLLERQQLEAKAEKLKAYLKIHRSIDVRTLKDKLELSEKDAAHLLRFCIEEGEIILIGRKYMLAGSAVPKEQQHETILNYVQKNQPVTRKELTELLGLADNRQIVTILKPLLDSGKLVRAGRNQYYLPDKTQEKG